MIKPIETVYNGRKFRSRLEARTAIYFDALGWSYEYEPEGFEIDGIKYLPDFVLKDVSYGRHDELFNLIVEVKGIFDDSAEQKAVACFNNHIPIYILEKLPRGGTKEEISNFGDHCGDGHHRNKLYFRGTKCDKCDEECHILMEPWESEIPRETVKLGNCLWTAHWPGEHGGFYLVPSLIRREQPMIVDDFELTADYVNVGALIFAAGLANQARFEFGETLEYTPLSFCGWRNEQ